MTSRAFRPALVGILAVAATFCALAACGSAASTTTLGGVPTALPTNDTLPPGTDATPTAGGTDTGATDTPQATVPPLPRQGSTTTRTVTVTPKPSPTPSPTPVPPTIVSFQAPQHTMCEIGTAFTIHLSWNVTNATGVNIAIDGPGLYNSTPYPPADGEDFPYSCDGNPHTYTLTTVGGTGPTARRTVTVNR